MVFLVGVFGVSVVFVVLIGVIGVSIGIFIYRMAYLVSKAWDGVIVTKIVRFVFGIKCLLFSSH